MLFLAARQCGHVRTLAIFSRFVYVISTPPPTPSSLRWEDMSPVATGLQVTSVAEIEYKRGRGRLRVARAQNDLFTNRHGERVAACLVINNNKHGQQQRVSGQNGSYRTSGSDTRCKMEIKVKALQMTSHGGKWFYMSSARHEQGDALPPTLFCFPCSAKHLLSKEKTGWWDRESIPTSRT